MRRSFKTWENLRCSALKRLMLTWTWSFNWGREGRERGVKCNTLWYLHTRVRCKMWASCTRWSDHSAEYFARWICYCGIVEKFPLRNNRHARYCIILDNERWLFQHSYRTIWVARWTERERERDATWCGSRILQTLPVKGDVDKYLVM